MNRVDIGWAVFLSAPVGAGVWLAVLKTSGGQDQLTAVGAGVAAAVSVFLIALGGAVDWSGDADSGDRE